MQEVGAAFDYVQPKSKSILQQLLFDQLRGSDDSRRHHAQQFWLIQRTNLKRQTPADTSIPNRSKRVIAANPKISTNHAQQSYLAKVMAWQNWMRSRGFRF